ncbi:GGDEF domain-containing protein [Edaphobacter sp.]|uniref:GGDEF domain-containing protein n=1 Tax=Edaphobacter sp. TaxID=1934404 RepID=UPI002DB9D1D0|nr:GGDEF domain-containing protein [Edaphobacter sp.]HEU5341861.1 GGDEF domain-containing protein [Edaphobacter sp.]
MLRGRTHAEISGTKKHDALMNYAFLPDLSALTILVVILFLLHRRHPHKQADIWLLGLFFTLVEATAHTFYAPGRIPEAALHVIVLDCYALAGLIFNWGAGEEGRSRRTQLLYVGLNAVPLLAVTTTYGLNIRVAGPYFPAIAAGLVIGVVSSAYLRRSWIYAVLYAAGWLAVGLLVHHGYIRHAVYWSICCVYSIAALNFRKRLPRNSTGRLAILTGFTIWSLCFLLHPWIVMHRGYADLASHVWNMQKSLISIGMILVMLEEQVRNNQWLALHDELTGLPNRRQFTERLAGAMERSRREEGRLAVFLLDLNGFKEINDENGHQAGDHVLREMSNNLRECSHFFDSVARLGGDEFTMVACDLTPGRSVHFFEDMIQRAVERPIVLDGRPIVMTASLGFAIYPDDAVDASRLLRIADQRMYRLKHRATRARIEMEPGLVETPPA